MRKSIQSMRLMLLILAPSIILRALASDILLPCVPNITEFFCVHSGVTQWVLSIYFIGAGVGQLFIGPMADEYGRRRVLLWSTAVIVVTTYACTLVTDINVLIFVRLLQGLGACGTTVVSMAIIRDISSDEALSRMFSYFNSIVALAPLFAPLLGGILLMKTGDWRAPFYFITAFSIAALVIDYFFVYETNPDLTKRKTHVDVPILKSYKMLFTDRNFLSYTACNVLGISCVFLFFSMSSIILIKIMGIDPDLYGYYFMITSAMFMFGNLISSVIVRYLRLNNTIIFGSLLMLLGSVIMLFVNNQYGLSTKGFLIPTSLITMGVGLLLGPGMAGVIEKHKHIAGIAAAAFGSLFLGGSALIVALIMQLEVIDTSNLSISVMVMSCINLLIMRNLLRKSK